MLLKIIKAIKLNKPIFFRLILVLGLIFALAKAAPSALGPNTVQAGCAPGYYCLGTTPVDIPEGCNYYPGYCTQKWGRYDINCNSSCGYYETGAGCKSNCDGYARGVSGNCCAKESGNGNGNGGNGGCNWDTKPDISPGACTQANGLRGQYYRDNPTGGPSYYDGGLKMERNDATVDFNWGGGAPSGELCSDNFSTLWTGYINLSETGNWRFGAESDDGFAIDLELTPGNWARVFDDWNDHAPRRRWGSWRTINAGWYGIRVWYYENGGGAVARLRYEGPGVGAQIVPSTSLRTCSAPIVVTPPTNPQVTNLTPTSAQLNWTSGTGGVKQLLRLDESQSEVESGCPGGCLIKEDNLDKDLQLYNTGGVLEPGITYYWRVVEYYDPANWADFAVTPSFTTPADPWTKTQGGDIHANAQITFSRPVPSGEYNALYLISSQSTLNANVTSDPGWLVPLYPEGDLTPSNNSGIDAPDYARLQKLFLKNPITGSGIPAAGTLQNDRVYQVTSSGTINGVYNVPANTNALIFIDGTLTIAAEIRVPSSSSLTFIAQNLIQIGKQLAGGGPSDDVIQATLIAEGDINTAYNRTSPTEIHRQLVVQGSLISLQGTIRLYRNLGDSGNGTTPAELIIINPKQFIFQKSVLSRPKIFWQEVKP